MTKLSYEIYDVRNGERIAEFTDYERMKQTLAEIKQNHAEAGEYCPVSYRQKYTPQHEHSEDRNYIQFFKDKFAKERA